MRATTRLAFIGAILLGLRARGAFATETCGNGVDDDSDSLADEGCYPQAVTGLCESPLSCGAVGAVSPKLGSLAYQLPPDVSFTPPYGGEVAFQRTYLSQYSPGYSFPTYKAPLGYRFHHNYMSWLLAEHANHVVLHFVTGQDVHFTYDQKSGGYEWYTAQAGFHV